MANAVQSGANTGPIQLGGRRGMLLLVPGQIWTWRWEHMRGTGESGTQDAVPSAALPLIDQSSTFLMFAAAPTHVGGEGCRAD